MSVLLESYRRSERIDAPSRKGRTPERWTGLVASVVAQSRIPFATIRSWSLISLAGAVLLFCLVGPMAGGTVAVLGLGLVSLTVWRRASVNRRSIDRDLPAFLTSVASSVRAGIDPLAALIAVRDYFPQGSPLMEEVEKVRAGLADGGDDEELLESFLSIYGSQEGELFKRSLILSRRHGSSLAEPLHRITKVIRQRQSFRRKIRAALAMHRMSAIGIALCAVAMGGLQVVMNPRAIEIAIHHPVGGVLLVIGGALIAGGVGWMMVMGRETSSR